MQVGGDTYVARKGVVLNTGTAPAAPPIDGLQGTPYWTNRDAVALTELPASLVVLGGGAIGCELAQVFARFGVEVTVVEMADRLVAAEEPEASALLAKAFEDEGIRVLTGVRIASVAHDDGGFTLDLGDRTVAAEKLLVAAGRKPHLDFIGLDTVGLPDDLAVIETDERMRAGDRLWAIGDITGKGAFTHVSMYQGAVVVRDVLGERGPWADYRAVPRVTFTSPEVASVGLSERAARDAGARRGGLHRGPRAPGAGWPRRRAWSSWSPTVPAASWWAAASSARPRERCCRCSRRPCMPRSR